MLKYRYIAVFGYNSNVDIDNGAVQYRYTMIYSAQTEIMATGKDKEM